MYKNNGQMGLNLWLNKLESMAKAIVDITVPFRIYYFHFNWLMSFQSGSIVYAWDSLDVEGDDIIDSRDSSGRVVFQHRTVDNLEQDTAYVAKIKVIKGVNLKSPCFHLTRGEFNLNYLR